VKNKFVSRALVVVGHEDVHEQDWEIEMLRHKLSEEELMILKLNMKGMYAFCVCL
jgi:hypothetical protein